MTTPKLVLEFPTPDMSQWEALVAQTLGGKDLTSLDHTIAGETFKPLYPPASTPTRPRPSPPTSLYIAPRHDQDLAGLDGRYDGVYLDASWSTSVIRREFRRDDTVLLDTHPQTGAELDDVIGWNSVVFHDPFLTGESSVNEHLSLLGYVTLDGAAWEIEGADCIDELTAVAAGVLDGLRAGARQFHLRLAVTPKVFETIAKRRALDAIVQRLADWADQDLDAHVHALTSPRTYSLFDPYTNILRAGCATFAALTAGFESVAVLPHDYRCATATDGLRIATNLPHVLREESHLTRTFDAAGGSGYIEALTDTFARTAWQRLVEIEAAGGLGMNVQRVKDRLTQNNTQTAKHVATRRQTLVGINDFVDHLTLNAEAPYFRSSRVDGALGKPHMPAFAALGWENLVRAAAGHSVSIVGVGELRRHKARMDYVERLVRSAGLKIEEEAQTVFLCGHDDDYGTLGVETAAALTAKGCRVVVAGRPGELADAWRTAGVEHFVFVGGDVQAVISSILEAHT